MLYVISYGVCIGCCQIVLLACVSCVVHVVLFIHEHDVLKWYMQL